MPPSNYPGTIGSALHQPSSSGGDLARLVAAVGVRGARGRSHSYGGREGSGAAVPVRGASSAERSAARMSGRRLRASDVPEPDAHIFLSARKPACVHRWCIESKRMPALGLPRNRDPQRHRKPRARQRRHDQPPEPVTNGTSVEYLASKTVLNLVLLHDLGLPNDLRFRYDATGVPTRCRLRRQLIEASGPRRPKG